MSATIIRRHIVQVEARLQMHEAHEPTSSDGVVNRLREIRRAEDQISILRIVLAEVERT